MSRCPGDNKNTKWDPKHLGNRSANKKLITFNHRKLFFLVGRLVQSKLN